MWKHLPQQMEDLLTMAKGCIGTGGVLKMVSMGEGGMEESEVRLSNFATWIQSIGHRPPAEFPWLPEPITLSNMDWPWGRHETDLLRKFAAAADRFWKRYDPNEPGTAPTNEQVTAWITAQGVSVRTAEVMASMLRADGLRTGPRK
jgi:hypothetical protein